MKAVRIKAGSVEMADVPDPRIAGEFALVKILAAPMCTEYYLYRDGYDAEFLGHEAAGEVAEAGPAAKVKKGERVVMMPQYPCGKCGLCSAGEYIHCENNVDPLEICGSKTGTATYAQYAIKADWLLLPIPEGMSYEHASMACCGMGPTFGAMQLTSVSEGDTVLITGMGPVGLGGIINAGSRGARVIAVESHPFRARLALEMGAEAVINPESERALAEVMDLTKGIGADKSIETSGNPKAKDFILKATKRKGKVGLVGWKGKLEADEILRRGLSVYGAWHWNLRDAGILMDVISRSGSLIDKLITNVWPMRRVKEAFDLQVAGNCGKIILKPWE